MPIKLIIEGDNHLLIDIEDRFLEVALDLLRRAGFTVGIVRPDLDPISRLQRLHLGLHSTQLRSLGNSASCSGRASSSGNRFVRERLSRISHSMRLAK